MKTEPSAFGPTGEGGEAPRLSEREEAIRRVLAARDKGLEGMLLYLVRAMAESERPAGVHMLCHAGRELSLGVLRYLAAEGRALSEAELNSIGKDDKHKATIARALRLPPKHPAVDAWHRVHRALHAGAHITESPPSPEEARSAANALLALLWGRLGPFFSAKEDIERLLTAPTPTAADLESLRVAITRPAVRWDFFKRLEHPGWVRPLLEGGFFTNPPGPITDESGRQKWDSWSEGDFLRRMASRVPADVRDAITSLPPKLKNPWMWDTAAEAAKEMPPDIASSLVPTFRLALEHALPWRLQNTLGELAAKLGEAGETSALALAGDALRVVAGAHSTALSLSGEGKERKKAELYGLEQYEAEQLIPKLAAVLPKVNAEKALKLFSYRVNDALTIEWGSPEEEPTWDPSKHWCPDLSEAREHHGFLENMAVAAAQVACGDASQGPEPARKVLEFVDNQPWRVYRRLRLLVLSRVGEVLQHELNAVVSDTRFIADEFPPHEYRILLEDQFANASEESRQSVIDAVLRGPGTDDEILALLRSGEPDESLTQEDARKYRIRWQRKRLRRFGANVPSELKELAASLDAVELVPRPVDWEIELEDKGSTGGMAWTGGPRSPLTPEELSRLSAEELLVYLREFKPVRDGFDSPTPSGLAVALASRIREEPDFGAELAKLIPSAQVDRTYVRAVLEGFSGAVNEGRAVPWSWVLPLVEWVALQVTEEQPERLGGLDCGDPNWRWAQREGAKLVSLAATKNLGPAADAELLWRASEALLRSDSTWNQEADIPASMDAALGAALNTLAGDAAEALLDVMLWSFRRSRPDAAGTGKQASAGNETETYPFPVERLRAGIDYILTRDKKSAYPALVMLGQYLPQLLLVDREWVLSKTPELFEQGFFPPLTNPVWGGYVTRAGLYNRDFEDLRKWHVRAAEALPEPTESTLFGEQQDVTWSPTRHLLWRCLLAALRGLVSPTDNDSLLPLLFERSSVEDRSHAYWEVFHNWKGTPGTIPEAMVARLLSFWSWRLNVLIGQQEKARRSEAGALGWLAITNALSDDQVLPLLQRTVELAEGAFPMEHSMWGRLERLAEMAIVPVIEMVDRIIRAELRGEYQHFNLSDLGPTLEIALKSEEATVRHRAEDIVNLLGDHGFTEFGTLL
jgi:hypothetical protein